MRWVRALASVLGCLPVLAGGFTAAAVTLSGAPTAERGAASAPCTHCDDCGGTPCPAPMAACVQACSGVVPLLVVATVRYPILPTGEAHWSPCAIALSGLSPLPDPFPPRT